MKVGRDAEWSVGIEGLLASKVCWTLKAAERKTSPKN
jgi:hypothetical protein